MHKHEKHIIHRDLKPQNVLVAHHGDEDKITIKLTDFGFSCNTITESKTKNISCGTPTFMAPELLKKKVRNVTEKVDIWAVGVMIHYLLTGQYPFDYSEGGDDSRIIRTAILNKKVKISTDLNPQAYHLVK